MLGQSVTIMKGYATCPPDYKGIDKMSLIGLTGYVSAEMFSENAVKGVDIGSSRSVRKMTRSWIREMTSWSREMWKKREKEGKKEKENRRTKRRNCREFGKKVFPSLRRF